MAHNSVVFDTYTQEAKLILLQESSMVKELFTTDQVTIVKRLH